MSDLGKLGWAALKEKLEREGINYSDYMSDLGKLGAAAPRKISSRKASRFPIT
jgi:hypothetical protein